MQIIKQYNLGRVLVLRCEGELDGTGPTPEQVLATAQQRKARFLLLDTTRAAYADTNGLRWLMRLRTLLEAAGLGVRVAALPRGKVRRILSLLQLGLDVHDSCGHAWKTPWRKRPAEAHPKESKKPPKKESKKAA
ncbi:MAG: STAS domain-containing protein [Armatimonadota bacterium]|nr:STAS domain-containing protein [Armatimonadota bacterium]